MEKSTGAIIIQGDKSILLEVHHEAFPQARADIAPFTEIEKSPEHFHTYRFSPLTLWNASSAGYSPEIVIEILQGHSRYPIPENVIFTIKDIMGRFGQIQIHPGPEAGQLLLKVQDISLGLELKKNKTLAKILTPYGEDFLFALTERGTLKVHLLKLGYPVEDLVPMREGDPLPIRMKERMPDGKDLVLRSYQKDSLEALLGGGQPGTGYGTVVLPCGAGKTVVGIGAMSRLKTKTLILTPNVSAVHQWIEELLEKTDLDSQDIGEYTGSKKEVKSVTVATYQVLVWRKKKVDPFLHFELFSKENWGLIIYDEVHLLPAPVFKVVAEIQSIRRLGLTATLVREDGAEGEVFSLVGPKKYDAPWKDLESQGWIAKAYCREIRIDLPEEAKLEYSVVDKRKKFRLSSENPLKKEVVRHLLHKHSGESILIIGQYLDQLEQIALEIEVPLITGKTKQRIRDDYFQRFREGEIKVLAVSKVANFAINLPDASVAVQVSGTFGSRQEEAQRLGRILRPKERPSHFYSLVSRFTAEEEFSANRQKFLTEQGYAYSIDLWEGEA
jgi:DNA excision repair protein ERCC-3